MSQQPRRMTRRSSRLWYLVLVLASFALGGCATTHPLMPTPVLYTGPQARPLFIAPSSDDGATAIDLLYITNRAPATGSEETLPYTSKRSRSVAFGSTTVEFGQGVTWDTLARQSAVAERTAKLDVKLGETKELGRFPPIPYAVAATAGGLSRAPAVIAGHQDASRGLQAEVARRLALSPRKEVVLYVHGVDNTFEDAALTMGELCHFLGREFVCGIFTWPAAGGRGILGAYEFDYESSVFATEHLRKAIRAISTTPGLERIHLLAHSRGTDVLVSALSDLNYEGYTQRSNVAQRNKVGNVMLMAPDLDLDVATAKLFKALSDPDVPYGTAPNPHMVIETTPGFHITVYVSPDDRALATSGWLFGSFARLGRLDATMLTPDKIELARTMGILDFVQVPGRTDLFGHSYFTSNPNASADLIALLRYGLRPNEPGRPLEEIERPFWRVPTGQP